MVRLRVQVDSVMCKDTEDVVGGDEFYIVGAAVPDTGAPTPKATAVLTTPIGIQGGQSIGIPPDQALVFDGDLPLNGAVRGGLTAWDEDAAKDWSKRPEWMDKISGSVGAAAGTAIAGGLASNPIGWAGIIAGGIAAGVLGTVYLASSQDKDDQLGQLVLNIPALGVDNEQLSWSFSRKDWTGYSSWNYTVNYSIYRQMMTDAEKLTQKNMGSIRLRYK